MTPTSSNSGMNTSPTTMTGKVMRWTMLLSRFVSARGRPRPRRTQLTMPLAPTMTVASVPIRHIRSDMNPYTTPCVARENEAEALSEGLLRYPFASLMAGAAIWRNRNTSTAMDTSGSSAMANRLSPTGDRGGGQHEQHGPGHRSARLGDARAPCGNETQIGAPGDAQHAVAHAVERHERMPNAIGASHSWCNAAFRTTVSESTVVTATSAP